MRILLHVWNAYMIGDWLDLFKGKNITYKTLEWNFTNKNEDEGFVRYFSDNISARDFDAVMSINYFPLISKMCMQKGIKYIAWCYDNPLNVERIEDTLNYSCNYVFLFDRIQCLGYQAAGIETVWHLPLGIHAERFRTIEISTREKEKYGAQVAFVGNLYNSQLPAFMAPLEEYTRGFLNALLDIQSQLYGLYLFDDMITEELVADINRQYRDQKKHTKLVLNKKALTFAMASEVTRNERILLLNLLGKRYQTKFYSYDQCDQVRNVEYMGSLDAVQELPKAFRSAKINLNPSLKCIQSGIPLRAFEIMGSGGFLLSNYQQELAEMFVDGEDMVFYESIGDAVEKTEFYLAHEDIRLKIAQSGCRKTLEEHSLQTRMEEMWKIIGF